MTLRCGCPNDGDPIVFGEVHECSKDPELRYTRTGALPRLVPSWRFVVPESEPVLRDRWDMDDDERRGF